MSIFKKAENPEKTGAGAKTAKIGRRAVDKRNKSLKTLSVTSTILFIVIVLVFNLVFDKLLGSILKWDWTPGGLYTIGDVSKEILAGMTKNVEIVGLFDKETDSSYTDVLPMLENYAKQSNNHITLRYVNPDKVPSILTEVDPKGYLKPEAGNFVVICKDTGKAKNVTYNDVFDIQMDEQTYQQYLAGVTAEQSFSGAIKYVQSETTPVIYFSSGHEEIDYTKNYSVLDTILKNNNYDVKSLDLFGLDVIPADCKTLIMASPKKDITIGERKLLANYLQKGGSLMVITDYNNSEFPELNILLTDFNLEISNSKIREGNKDYRYQDDPYTLRANAPASTITEQAIDRLTLADNVRAINKLSITKEWITVEPVLTTSPEGYTELKGDAGQSSAAGVQNVAMICENKGWMDGTNVKESAKVMLVGSSSIFSDAVLQSSSNIYNVYLFYYGVQWLSNASGDSSLYIKAKVPASYAVTKGTPSSYVMAGLTVMLLLPGALLLAALFVYRKRKHL